MKTDLKNMSRKELEKLQGNIDKALDKLEVAEKKTALEAAEKAAKALGYSLGELTGAKAKRTVAIDKPAPKRKARKSSDGRGKVAPKYKHPENPEMTCAGRGRKPKWVEAHLEAGGTLEEIGV